MRKVAPAIKEGTARFVPEAIANAVVGLAIGRIATGALSRSAGGSATFYRGVSAAEGADVAATGQLRAGAAAAGNTGKYLTNTVQAAAEWGAMNGPGFQVFKITVPTDATRAFVSLGRIDGIGQAWWAPTSALRGASIETLPILTTVP
jgi:hypothetical protein